MADRGRRKLDKAAGDDLGALRAAIARADAERADAVRSRQDLEDQRADVVAEGDDATLRDHDESIQASKRRIDLAESAHARLVLDIRAAEHQAEQSRRAAIYAQGEAAMAKATALMTGDYVTAANAVVAVLRQVAELRAVARAANSDLPEGASPISLNAEPFSGRIWAAGLGEEVTELRLFHRETGEPAPANVVSGPSYVERRVKVRRSVPSVPLEPHRAIADFVNLPGLEPESYIYVAPFWGQPRV